jgi:penicillin amidase
MASHIRLACLIVALVVSAPPVVETQPGAARPQQREREARAALPQYDGAIVTRGLSEPVEVLRDQWGVPHIYARNTADLFFAQGFTVAQDRMWQLELWRRNGEGRLAEVLGPGYVTRDRFARLLAFRGDWDEEFRKYHPEGRVIFDAFAAGINLAVQRALDDDKVPVEFKVMGFQPQPVWTAKTILTRMPGWTLSRNVASEVQRAIDVRTMGLEKTRELKPTDPAIAFTVPPGLDLEDITPEVLNLTRGANDIRWDLGGAGGARGALGPGAGVPGAEVRGTGPGAGETVVPLPDPDLGSNNWVIGGSKSATGMPVIANDPHREVVNPALRYVVHLNAPGWNAIGASEPGLPGISIGHNDRLAWGFTILGMDQQDLYVEETHPSDPNQYLWKGEWQQMEVERQLIYVRGRAEPEAIDLKFTRHGPVLHENTSRRRAFALKWVGAEPGGAGYIGSLNVMQTKSMDEFRSALARAWYLPSHSLVYADVDGNYAYFGVALTPRRKNWDGLMPVPGKDGAYEWDGFVPFDELPFSRNDRRGFYNSSNNDVVPKILPGYRIPLGYEYSAPYRYDRAFEVLSQPRTFTVRDMEALQQDATSLIARRLVPLLKNVQRRTSSRVSFNQAVMNNQRPAPMAGVGLTSQRGEPLSPDVVRALDMLLAWNVVLDKTSPAATLFEYWFLKLQPRAYGPHLPAEGGARVTAFDPRRVIAWMTSPDQAYGRSRAEREETRDAILLEALQEAVADLRKRHGDRWAGIAWGEIHTADFVHPLASAPGVGGLFRVEPVRKSGDAYTLLASSSATESGTKQLSGASFAFVFDVKDWDNSTGLNTPGQSAQPLSPHYQDLAAPWAEGRYFPLAFSRAAVEKVTTDRLLLQPYSERIAVDGEPRFEPVQPSLFSLAGAQPNAWGDFDGDGDLDYFVGMRGQIDRLYRNDHGTFTDVATAVGLGDADETRAAAWGDMDNDGDLDLFVGFAVGARVRNKLYRNDAGRFTEVGREAGIDLFGTSRQPAWIDYDHDGDNDLFVAFRDRPNVLYRNDGRGRFEDVASDLGLADPRRSVGAVWFDIDQDGDLDLFVANQNGDANGLFRNDGGRFTDIAGEAGVSGKGRPPLLGGVGPAVADYDLDGDLDLFIANYGPDNLYRNDGRGRFTDVAVEAGVAGDTHETTAVWGDYDNDGDPDLYLASFLTGVLNSRDRLFRNDGSGRFTDVTPAVLLKWDGSHGVQWTDFDGDGALDLALADNHPLGRHPIFRGILPAERAKRSVRVMVVDARGRQTTAGVEVRAYAAGAAGATTSGPVVASGMMDAGSGYCSQSVQPVHLGIPGTGSVDIAVTAPVPGRPITWVRGVVPAGQLLTVRLP